MAKVTGAEDLKETLSDFIAIREYLEARAEATKNKSASKKLRKAKKKLVKFNMGLATDLMNFGLGSEEIEEAISNGRTLANNFTEVKRP